MAAWAIRDAVPRDAETIAAFAQQTFRENFTHYDPAALSEFLPKHYSIEKFRAQLSNPAYRFWLAESQGSIIGYANLGNYKLPLQPAALPVVELHRLYVAKEWQGRKIGATLMDLALAEATAQKAQTLYLGVWENNRNAQAFYARYGFFKAGEYNYPPVGGVIDREWIMMRNVML